MTKSELWDTMVKRNPQFVTGPISFMPHTLEKFFNLVWDTAVKSVKPSNESNPFESIFGSAFK